MTNPTTAIERDPAKLSDALPWYLNDTLSHDDRAWVEQMLAQDEKAARSLEFDRQLTTTLEQRVAELPADLGWEKLLTRVRTDSAQEQGLNVAQSAPQKDGLMATMADFISRLLSPRVGMALAVILAAQTMTIGYLVQQPDQGDQVEYRSVGNVRPVPVIRAMVSDALSEKALREALSERGLNIVDGPNQLGEYLLRADEADLNALAADLKTAGVLSNWSIDQHIVAQ